MTNYICAICKDGMGYCKNWDGTGDGNFLSKIPGECKVEESPKCEFLAEMKPVKDALW